MNENFSSRYKWTGQYDNKHDDEGENIKLLILFSTKESSFCSLSHPLSFSFVRLLASTVSVMFVDQPAPDYGTLRLSCPPGAKPDRPRRDRPNVNGTPWFLRWLACRCDEWGANKHSWCNKIWRQAKPRSVTWNFSSLTLMSITMYFVSKYNLNRQWLWGWWVWWYW